ncbi:hypothetical protein [uncultured Limosilactobacillus sp.]|uniref:hypothetical protein n=1 Tax=uncultured Limosilactobacillus sp. TaxID=2837629 RepID=UPI0025DDEF00|nr:hypothetical protein [uncultured Limosilactobacillus sp.]
MGDYHMLTIVIIRFKQFILKIQKVIFKSHANNIQKLNEPKISKKDNLTQEQRIYSIHKDEKVTLRKTIKNCAVLTNNDDSSVNKHRTTKSISSKFENRKGKLFIRLIGTLSLPD